MCAAEPLDTGLAGAAASAARGATEIAAAMKRRGHLEQIPPPADLDGALRNRSGGVLAALLGLPTPDDARVWWAANYRQRFIHWRPARDPDEQKGGPSLAAADPIFELIPPGALELEALLAQYAALPVDLARGSMLRAMSSPSGVCAESDLADHARCAAAHKWLANDRLHALVEKLRLRGPAAVTDWIKQEPVSIVLKVEKLPGPGCKRWSDTRTVRAYEVP